MYNNCDPRTICFSTIRSKTILFNKIFKNCQPIYKNIYIFSSWRNTLSVSLCVHTSSHSLRTENLPGPGRFRVSPETNCKHDTLELSGTAFTCSLPATPPSKSPSKYSLLAGSVSSHCWRKLLQENVESFMINIEKAYKSHSTNSLWVSSHNVTLRGSWVNSSKKPHRIP